MACEWAPELPNLTVGGNSRISLCIYLQPQGVPPIFPTASPHDLEVESPGVQHSSPCSSFWSILQTRFCT